MAARTALFLFVGTALIFGFSAIGEERVVRDEVKARETTKSSREVNPAKSKNSPNPRDVRAAGVRSSGGGGHVAAQFVRIAQSLRDGLVIREDELPEWFSLEKFTLELGLNGAMVLPVDALDVPAGAKLEKGLFIDAYFTQAADEKSRATIQLLSANLEKIMENPFHFTSICHLVLHEYLGVMGLEGHGEYLRSAELLKLLKDPIIQRFANWMITIQPATNLLDPAHLPDFSGAKKVNEAMSLGRAELEGKHPQGLLWKAFSFGGKGKVNWGRSPGHRVAIVTVNPYIELENAQVMDFQFSEFEIEFHWETVKNKLPRADIRIYQHHHEFSHNALTNVIHAQCLTLLFKALMHGADGPQKLAKLLGGSDPDLEEMISQVVTQFAASKEPRRIPVEVRAQLPGVPVTFALELEI